MRPNKHQVFRTGAAAKLDQLELIAALLERDATNNRVLIAELAYAHPTAGELRRAQRRGRWRKLAQAAGAAAHRCIATATALARNQRLHSAIRACYTFGVDFAFVLAAACAGVAALTAAILLTAPPA
jgi:hypothetical protein